MSPLRRLRQSCRKEHRVSADAASAGARAWQGSSGAADALRGHPPLTGAAGVRQGQDDPEPDVNHVYLSGVLANDPQRDRDRSGDPVLLLMVAFRAPDTRDAQQGAEGALTEIEVSETIAESHLDDLRLGRAILITGRLSGGGGVTATAIYTGGRDAGHRDD